jgi:4-amino-4-deoxy-L-arabinose transferase-like glycosyltransferase
MKQNYLLVLLLLFAFGLRVFNLDKYGLYIDEKFTVLNAHGICVGGINQPEVIYQKYFTPRDFWKPKTTEDFFNAVARSDFGTHIVYNYALNTWVKVFGISDFSLRFPSVIFNVALIALVYYVVKKYLKDTKTALFAALLLAIEPLNIALSHFARSYTLSFLLLMASTYFFIEIIRYPKTDKRKYLLVSIYGILVTLSLLNHYLNFLVPVCHVFVFLIYERKIKNWVLMSIAAAFTGGVMFWWFTSGGGQWSMQFLKDKNALHLKLAMLPPDQNPMSGTVDPSTFRNVSMKALPLFFDLNPLSNGLFKAIMGIKNLVIFSVIFIFFIIGIRNLASKKYIISGVSLLVILALSWLYTGRKSGILLGLLIFYLLYLFAWWWRTHRRSLSLEARSLIIISFMMMFLPLIYIVTDAFKSGHTTSLSQRYIGFSIPFVAIILAVGISELTTQQRLIRYFMYAIMMYQGVNLYHELNDLYEDRSPKYTFVTNPRIPNPYKSIADQIMSLYVKGDTVLIPSKNETIYSSVLKKNEIDFNDAQNLNVYLPKDSDIPERIDINEHNKFYVVHRDGTKELIFDMQGTRYRY